MIRWWCRLREEDSGSLVIGLLGLVLMTTAAMIGLSVIVSGEVASRHDNAFQQAFTGAQSGLSAMVAKVRAAPYSASFSTLTGSVPSSGVVTYTASAAATSAGHWLVTSSGTATVSGRTVTRAVQEQVDSAGIFDVPLFGDTALSIGTASDTLGSAVDTYDSTGSSQVCDASGKLSSMTVPDSRMCVNDGFGMAATDGTLTMRGSDLSAFSQVDIDNAAVNGYSNPDATGTCGGDTTTCAMVGSKVVEQPTSLDYPAQSVCSSGVGANADADVPLGGFLHAGVNVVPDGYTFNADVVANLNNLNASQVIVCFSGQLKFNVVGSNSLVPLNSVPTVDTSLSALTGTLQSLLSGSTSQQIVTYAPRPPSTLVFVDTSTSAGQSSIDFGSGLGQTIDSTLGLGNETSMSAVFYAPNASCTAHTHLDVYGALVCGSVSAPDGVDVHYDRELQNTTLQQSVTVSNWRECEPASACQP